MAPPRPIPVVVGVGDIKNKSKRLEDALEPMELMLKAIQFAIADTNLSTTAAEELRLNIDSIDAVSTWTWPYPDLPQLLASKLNIDPQHKFYSEHGGHQPARLFDQAARRIALGQSNVAVVTGGEALASLSAFAAANQMPPPGWTKPAKNVESVFSPTTRDLGESVGAIHSIGSPIQVYPLYENGFRAHRKQSFKQNNAESAQLYAEFAKVSEQNQQSWNYGKPAETAEAIGTVSGKNRMICFPYPLLMNAFNTVNLGGACILTSTDYARKLGIPESRWIYPLGGAGTMESYNFWERTNYYSSPALSRALDAALEVSNLVKEQIDLFDFYSCFPIVPKLACEHLGLPITNGKKPITLLGGLTSFGGAGNNYSMHSIIEMVRHLRKMESGRGLVLANGGTLTAEHVLCLSSRPRDAGSPYPDRNPLPEVVTDVPIAPLERYAEGEATIETYTVEFKRDGSPLRGHIVGILKRNGHRFIANHADENTLQDLSSGSREPIGRSGWVRPDGQKPSRNLFTFEAHGKL